MFYVASAFNQDLSSWNVGKVTTMFNSESSVRSLLLLLVVVGRGVLSSVYTSLSPPLSLSLSLLLLLLCSSLIGVPPSLSSSPLTLVSSAPSSS